uniref:Uncharacterized protein LOC104230602 n=1 Tax=Nicotiana sylvestris TaxID=4096 RepID=A0A1U7WWS4_NICSY|nr:PREDICTED: uncharacterized protein LOC104230602 [Nicotiana sylvestris]
MTRSCSKEVIPYDPEVEKRLRQLRKEKEVTRKFTGQSSSQENMDKNGEEEAATRAAVEEALRADETIDGNRRRRFNLNRYLIEDEFENNIPRRTPNNAIGGPLMKKTPEEIVAIINGSGPHLERTTFGPYTHEDHTESPLFQDKIRNEVIQEKVCVAPMDDKMRESRLRLFGHGQRRSPDAPVRRCERLDLAGTRIGRGRPKKYWGEVSRRDMTLLQISEDMTLDRKVWKSSIRVVN